nr:SDR family oxidoreductase [uncultured Rhodoferax sp.]
MIFVTGVTGLVGGALVNHLLAKGQRVAVGLRRANSYEWPKGVEPQVMGNLGQDPLDNLDLCGVRVVVHCAARAHVMHDTEADPLSAYRRVNVKGSLELLRRAAACGVRRFVYISSIKVNGESTTVGRVFRADDPPYPQDPYGVSKREAEDALRALALAVGMEFVIVRPPLVYGPGVKANFASMMRWLSWRVPLPLGGVTNNRRSFVALDNLVDLIFVCINHPAAANEVFLASDGEDLSTTELLRRMGSALGKPVLLLAVPVHWLEWAARLISKRNIYHRLCGSLQVDISKNQQLLGWTPPLTVDDGLKLVANEFLL